MILPRAGDATRILRFARRAARGRRRSRPGPPPLITAVPAIRILRMERPTIFPCAPSGARRPTARSPTSSVSAGGGSARSGKRTPTPAAGEGSASSFRGGADWRSAALVSRRRASISGTRSSPSCRTDGSCSLREEPRNGTGGRSVGSRASGSPQTALHGTGPVASSHPETGCGASRGRGPARTGCPTRWQTPADGISRCTHGDDGIRYEKVCSLAVPGQAQRSNHPIHAGQARRSPCASRRG